MRFSSRIISFDLPLRFAGQPGRDGVCYPGVENPFAPGGAQIHADLRRGNILVSVASVNQR